MGRTRTTVAVGRFDVKQVRAFFCPPAAPERSTTKDNWSFDKHRIEDINKGNNHLLDRIEKIQRRAPGPGAGRITPGFILWEEIFDHIVNCYHQKPLTSGDRWRVLLSVDTRSEDFFRTGENNSHVIVPWFP